MVSKRMLELGSRRSVIRETFEYGRRRAAEIGEERVFDFSLGNPSIPAPDCVKDTLQSLLAQTDPVRLHGYTSAAGAPEVRQALCDSIRRRFAFEVPPKNLYMTCGAAASLSITLSALLTPGDEVIVFAPFFPEYRVFIETAGGVAVVVRCREDDFQIDPAALEAAVTPRTRAVIINSPNNPTGVILSAQTLTALAGILQKKREQFGTAVTLIADEPYRELCYLDEPVPYVPFFYDDTAVCYSYSKSLSLPGERIGYILVSPRMPDCDAVCAAVAGAGRALGYVCAPALLQYAVAKLDGMTADLSAYRANRDRLYGALTAMGYRAVHPDGAFYLFVRSPEPDAAAFCEKARKRELLLVPSDDFGFPGYVRIAYCVTAALIERSLPAFRALIDEYKEK